MNDSTSSGCRTNPVLSAEIFVIPLEQNRFLVYAPLRQAAFVGNAQTVNLLACLKEGVYDAATDGKMTEFLRRLEIVDAGEETVPDAVCEGLPEPVAVSLLLTTACNLRCTYCYASAGDTLRESMPLHVAVQGIDFVLDNAVKRNVPEIEINYHGGGEPALNWQTLTGSLEYARKKAGALGLKTVADMATNGVLDDRQIDWVVDNLQGASVSFDGLPEVHDRHRITPSGKGSSARVMHTLRRFDQAGFNYGIRVTVTAGQIPYMAESIAFICASFNAVNIQVEPAYQIGRYAGEASAETEAFIDGFRKAQECAKKSGKSISFSGARVGLLTNHFCGLSNDSFTLLPNGTVSSCYEAFSDANPWGKILFYGQPCETGGYRFDMQRLEFLRRQSVSFRKHCEGCFAKWTCAGDCYHKSLVVTGSLEFEGTGRCHIIRELTKDQILARIAGAGGLCWHELPEQMLNEQDKISVSNINKNVNRINKKNNETKI